MAITTVSTLIAVIKLPKLLGYLVKFIILPVLERVSSSDSIVKIDKIETISSEAPNSHKDMVCVHRLDEELIQTLIRRMNDEGIVRPYWRLYG